MSPIQLGKWVVLFCDEINLPDFDKYGKHVVIHTCTNCMAVGSLVSIHSHRHCLVRVSVLLNCVIVGEFNVRMIRTYVRTNVFSVSLLCILVT